MVTSDAEGIDDSFRGHLEMKTRTATMQNRSFKTQLAIAVGALALIAMPHFAQAQGVFRGAEQGANQGVRDGNRAAGPIGGLVGGAVGLGVGGAVGGVKGVLGIPEGGSRRCRGYYNRH